MRAWILLLGSLLLPGVIDGINSCVDPTEEDYRCEEGTEEVLLNGCGLIDTDIPDVEVCLDEVGRGNIQWLHLEDNSLSEIPSDLLEGLGVLAQLHLENNALTTLPEGLFDELQSLARLYLRGNDLLQCVPDTDAYVDVDPSGPCDCDPSAAVLCDEGIACSSGSSGYTCGAAEKMAMHKLGGEPHLSDVRSTDIV